MLTSITPPWVPLTIAESLIGILALVVVVLLILGARALDSAEDGDEG